MSISDLDHDLFDELACTKERLKYISGCSGETFTENGITKQLVSHSQLDDLITNTVNLVFEIIEDLKGEYNICPSLLKQIVLDRLEKDFP